MTKKQLTWSEFTKGKMSPYMKSEGGHGGAMKRLSKEWAIYKNGFDIDFKNVKTIKPKKKAATKKAVVKKPVTKKPATKKPATKKAATKKPDSKKVAKRSVPTELRSLRNSKIKYDIRIGFLINSQEKKKIYDFLHKHRITLSQLFRKKLFPL